MLKEKDQKRCLLCNKNGHFGHLFYLLNSFLQSERATVYHIRSQGQDKQCWGVLLDVDYLSSGLVDNRSYKRWNEHNIVQLYCGLTPSAPFPPSAAAHAWRSNNDDLETAFRHNTFFVCLSSKKKKIEKMTQNQNVLYYGKGLIHFPYLKFIFFWEKSYTMDVG